METPLVGSIGANLISGISINRENWTGKMTDIVSFPINVIKYEIVKLQNNNIRRLN